MSQLILFPVPITGVKISKRKSPALDRIKVDHLIAKDRYYHHRRLDPQLFKVDGATRIIECEFKSFEDIPESKRTYAGRPTGQRYHISELIKLGYNVQYRAVHVPEKVPEGFELDFKFENAAQKEYYITKIFNHS